MIKGEANIKKNGLGYNRSRVFWARNPNKGTEGKALARQSNMNDNEITSRDNKTVDNKEGAFCRITKDIDMQNKIVHARVPSTLKEGFNTDNDKLCNGMHLNDFENNGTDCDTLDGHQ